MSVTVREGYFTMVYLITFQERLVPFGGQIQIFHILIIYRVIVFVVVCKAYGGQTCHKQRCHCLFPVHITKKFSS